MKIYILGTSGSGKSYLAKKISKKYNIKHLDLDDIFWRIKYSKSRKSEEKKKLLSSFVKENDSWVIEGVFTSFVLEAIKKADKIIWLDFNGFLMTYRVLLRTIKNKDFKNLVGLKYLLADISKYKIKKGMYLKHKKMVEDNNLKYVLIKNKRELNTFLEDL